MAAQLLLDLAALGTAVWLMHAAGRRIGGGTAAERGREALATLREGIQVLLGEAEERSRELERSLAARERSLRAVLRDIQAREAGPEGRPGARQERRHSLAAEVKRLTGAGLDVSEIARRVSLDPAGVRLLQDCEVDLR